VKTDKYVLGKIITWSFVCVLFSGLFFFVLQQSFTIPLFGGGDAVVLISRIFLPILLFSAFLGAVGIHGMIIKGRLYRYTTLALSSLTMFLFFQPTLWSAIALLLFFGGIVAYHITIQGDAASRINVVPLYTIAAGLGAVILVLIASVSFLYYSTFASRPYALDNIRTTLRDSIVSTTLSTLEHQVSGFTADLTVDQVIANLLVGRISVNFLPDFSGTDIQDNPNYQDQINQLKATLEKQTGKQAPESQIDSAVQDQQSHIADVATAQLSEVERQLIDEVRTQISDSIGVDLQGDETIRDALEKITDRKVITIVDPYLHYAPIVFAASLFLLLYIFSFLYRYLTRGFGLLWYEVLRLLHFIGIKEATIKGKRITLEH